MKRSKRFLALLTGLLMALPCLCASAGAQTDLPRASLSDGAMESLRAQMGWLYAWQDEETGLILYQLPEAEDNCAYGLADVDGTTISPRLYTDPFSFVEGVALVRYDAFFAYMLPDGGILSDGWTYAQPFEGGYAMVQLNGLYGLIDHAGSVVAEPIHDEPVAPETLAR